MASRSKPNRMFYLPLVGVAVLLLVVILLLLTPPPTAINALARGAALMGYFAIWLAIVSSYYMRELVKFFGQPFIKLHHAVAIGGLVWITIHPLAVAWEYGTWRVFVPDFSAWATFWRLAGRPSWYLLAIGTVVAVLRKAIGGSWRALHWLMYLGFILGTVHGVLMNFGLRYPLMRAIWILMAVSVVMIFAFKRLQEARRKKPRSRSL